MATPSSIVKNGPWPDEHRDFFHKYLARNPGNVPGVDGVSWREMDDHYWDFYTKHNKRACQDYTHRMREKKADQEKKIRSS